MASAVDLPPFTPLDYSDSDDLPEYTPFCDTETFEEVTEEIVEEVSEVTDFVQEVMVASAAPEEPPQFPEETEPVETIPELQEPVLEKPETELREPVTIPPEPEQVTVPPEPEPVNIPPEPVTIPPEPAPKQPEPVVKPPEPAPKQPEPVVKPPEPAPKQPEPAHKQPAPKKQKQGKKPASVPQDPVPAKPPQEPVPKKPASAPKEPVPIVPEPVSIEPAPVAVIEEVKETVMEKKGNAGLGKKKREKVKAGKPQPPAAETAKPEPVKPPAPEVKEPQKVEAKPDPRILALEKEIRVTRDKQRALQTQLAKAQKTLAETKQKQSKMTAALERARQSVQSLSTELSSTKQPEAEEKDEVKIKQLKARLYLMTEDETNKAQEFEKLRASKERRDKEAQAAREQIARLERERAELADLQRSTQSEEADYLSEIKRLQALIAKATAEIEKYRTSFSSKGLESQQKELAEKVTRAKVPSEAGTALFARVASMEEELRTYSTDQPEEPQEQKHAKIRTALQAQYEDVDRKLQKATKDAAKLTEDLAEQQLGCCIPLILLILGLIAGILTHWLALE